MSLLSQKRWPSRRFWLFTLGLCTTPLAVAWWRGRSAALSPAIPYKFPSRDLEELDRVVQTRFAVVPDNDFGVDRIGKRHGYFSPLSAQERRAIDNLKRNKREVLFYVVGRNTILHQQNYLSYSPVQGPVYITPNRKVNSTPQRIYTPGPIRFYSQDGLPVSSPTDGQLLKIGSRVFKDATLREGTNNKISSWNVVARPVTATSHVCVDCHNARAPWKDKSQMRTFVLSSNSNRDIVSLNDTLGVALYCYRTARKEPIQKLTPDELMTRRPEVN